MKVVIIEDELHTADDLQETLLRIDSTIEIVAILPSIKKAIAYFQTNTAPDLIFSDIQLGDGLSFEIFNTITVRTPVIFCTAYDEYALHAFKANGIEYILKPFNSQTISRALEKFNSLKLLLNDNSKLYEIFKLKYETNRHSLLVHYKDKVIPVAFDQIALFFIENEISYLLTFDQKKYVVSRSLDEIERLVGSSFFRVNRKCILNRKAIKDASRYFNRKLLVNLTNEFSLNEPITIGKTKTSEFLNWLINN